MIDDTAAEIVRDPDKFRAYLDTQARMDRYSAANALLIYKQMCIRDRAYGYHPGLHRNGSG